MAGAEAGPESRMISARPTARSWLKYVWLLLTREWDL